MLTVGQYQRFYQYTRANKSQEDLAYGVGLLSAIFEIAPEKVEAMPLSEIATMIRAVSRYIEDMQKEREVLHVYNIGGKPFMPVSDFHKITAGQYVDFIEVTKTDIVLNLHKIMAVVLLPAKEEDTWWGRRYVPLPYGAVPPIETAEFLRQHMDVRDAMRVSDFFLACFAAYVRHIITYSERKLTKIILLKILRRMVLCRGGGGLLRSMRLLIQLRELGRTSKG